MNNKGLIWFRNDLRIHDNEALYRASMECKEQVGIYCFDPGSFEKSKLGFPKTGNFRTQFLIESLHSLRKSLRKLGSELIVIQGKTEVEIPRIVKSLEIDSLYFHTLTGTEEANIESKLNENLSRFNIKLKQFWTTTLFHKEDLPFPIAKIPDVFSKFRKMLEKESSVRNEFPGPENLKKPENTPKSLIPSLYNLGLVEEKTDLRTAFPYNGGEEEALKQLNKYI